MAKKKLGRKSGGKNKGYFFRKGRGWYVSTPGGGMERLIGPKGQHLKDGRLAEKIVRESYARWLVNDESGREKRASSSAVSAPLIEVVQT